MTEQRIEGRPATSRPRRWARLALGTLIVMLTGIVAWVLIFAAAWDDHHTTMDTVLLVVGMLILVVLTLFVFGWLGSTVAKRRYAALQASRTPITDEEFCRRAGLDLTQGNIVTTTRNALAERGLGRYDATRIYPEDSLNTFELGYDDDVGWFVEGAQLIPGFHPDSSWFPVEEVTSVADFVRVVQRMKDEATAL